MCFLLNFLVLIAMSDQVCSQFQYCPNVSAVCYCSHPVLLFSMLQLQKSRYFWIFWDPCKFRYSVSLVSHPHSSTSTKYLLLIGSVSPCLCSILGKIYIINMLIIQKSNIKINVNSEAAEQYIPVFLLPHSLLLFVTLVGSSSSFRLLIVQGTRTQRLDFFLSLWTNPFMISASLVALHAINRLSLPKFICPA